MYNITKEALKNQKNGALDSSEVWIVKRINKFDFVYLQDEVE